jgi:hypothetical protein
VRENWRSVIGWENAYIVSDRGRVASIDRSIVAKNRYGDLVARHFKGRVLRNNITPSGYETVSLVSRGRKRYCVYIHQLVTRNFIGVIPDGLEICHNNGVRADNRLANLRYDTRSANALDRHKHGTMRMPRGEQAPSAKLNDKAVRLIRRSKEGQRALGRKFSVSHKTIASVVRGETWKHVQ